MDNRAAMTHSPQYAAQCVVNKNANMTIIFWVTFKDSHCISLR